MTGFFKWCVLATAFGISLAQAAEQPAVSKGDAAPGKGKSMLCAACHGVDGNSAMAIFPSIAGQGEAYFVKQLQDIRSGSRVVPEMTGIVAGLSEQDMRDLAAYFSAQAIKLGAADPELAELGQEIYRAGKAQSGVPACASCHGATGQGMPAAGFPALAGQHTDYLIKQLKAFRAAGRDDEAGARRTNDGESMMMRSTAAPLSDREIRAVSSYISGLH